MAWTSIVNDSQSWTTESASAHTWGANGITPSSESRLNRIFPQSAVTVEDLSFIHRVQSEGAFLVATDSGVYVRSGITEPF